MIDAIDVTPYEKAAHQDKGRTRDYSSDQKLTIDIEAADFRRLDQLAGLEHNTTKDLAEFLLQESIQSEYSKIQERKTQAMKLAAESLLSSLSPELALAVSRELKLERPKQLQIDPNSKAKAPQEKKEPKIDKKPPAKEEAKEVAKKV